jgi:hypothetical protein
MAAAAKIANHHRRRVDAPCTVDAFAPAATSSMETSSRPDEFEVFPWDNIPEATVPDVLRNSRFVIDVRSTVTITPLTGKSTRSEITRTRWVPGPIF